MIYVIVIAVLLFLGGAGWLKHEIAQNGELRAQKKQLEEVLQDTENAVVFQQGLNYTAQQRASSADARAHKNSVEAKRWQNEYSKLFDGTDDVATSWGATSLPPSVAFRMCRDDGHTDKECADQMAAEAQRGVQKPKSTGESLQSGNQALASGNQRVENSPQGLQLPTRRREGVRGPSSKGP